ncbi:helix-turn-helix transcriptional regulator [Ursidibacter sp. B-7004-1]
MQKLIENLVKAFKDELRTLIAEELDKRLNATSSLQASQFQEMPKPDFKFISIQEVIERFGVSRATIDRWLRPDSGCHIPDFPKKIKQGSLTFFMESEINAYMKKQLEQREQGGEQC